MEKVVFLKLAGIFILCILVWIVWGKREETEVPVSNLAEWEKTETESPTACSVGEGGAGKIALTFDDGPHPYYTEQLLDGFKDRGVTVTFFVTGEHAALHPEVVKRMEEEGHLIGNHTYSHLQLNGHNREAYKQELVKTNEVIEAITGKKVEFVRPPYGTWDKSLEQELDMIQVLWSVDPLDWCSKDASCIAAKVLGQVEENDIILMHDYYESSVTAALKIVDSLLERGYELVTVEELLLD